MSRENSPATEGELGNEQAVKTRLNRQRLQAKQEALDIDTILGMPEGRRVVSWVLDQCHLFDPSYIPDKPDLTNLREGERNVGLKIMAHFLERAPVSWRNLTLERMTTVVDERLRVAAMKKKRDEDAEDSDSE